jgi:hypothetical protein
VRRRAALLIVLCVLAVLGGAGALILLSGSSRSSAVSAATYRHYFAMGKSTCAQMFRQREKQPTPTPSGGINEIQVSVPLIGVSLVGQHVPPPYQAAVRAGCQAAAAGQ